MSKNSSKKPALSLMMNNVATRWPCAVCGGSTEKDVVPTAVCVAGTQEFVCNPCAERIDPDVLGMRDFVNGHDQEFGDELDAERRRKDLVSAAAWKPARRFVQIDGWQECKPGLSEDKRRIYASHPDEDGDVVMWCKCWELRNTDFPVRVQIAASADRETVLRLLAKAAKAVEDAPTIQDMAGDRDGGSDDIPF